MNGEQLILEKLEEIKKDVEEIKEHMVDVDTILTPEEEKRIGESLQDLKQGKTTSLEQFEKDIQKKDV